MTRKNIGYAFTVLGIVATVISLGADVLGIGTDTGIHSAQLIAAGAGVAVAVIGIWLVFGGAAKSG